MVISLSGWRLKETRVPERYYPDSEVPRHCEERSDEAIQSGAAGEMPDCFASRAMMAPRNAR
jgi:hypothetical protein